jgi:hypothetical protein
MFEEFIQKLTRAQTMALACQCGKKKWKDSMSVLKPWLLGNQTAKALWLRHVKRDKNAAYKVSYVG